MAGVAGVAGVRAMAPGCLQERTPGGPGPVAQGQGHARRPPAGRDRHRVPPRVVPRAAGPALWARRAFVPAGSGWTVHGSARVSRHGCAAWARCRRRRTNTNEQELSRRPVGGPRKRVARGLARPDDPHGDARGRPCRTRARTVRPPVPSPTRRRSRPVPPRPPRRRPQGGARARRGARGPQERPARHRGRQEPRPGPTSPAPACSRPPQPVPALGGPPVAAPPPCGVSCAIAAPRSREPPDT